jgi:hypothetical protein
LDAFANSLDNPRLMPMKVEQILFIEIFDLQL